MKIACCNRYYDVSQYAIVKCKTCGKEVRWKRSGFPTTFKAPTDSKNYGKNN